MKSGMLLKKLVDKIPGVERKGGKDVEIRCLSDDSRLAQPGTLFIARKGRGEEGARWIAQAVEAGASAVVTDLYDPFLKIPQIVFPEPEKLAPLLASRFYGDPSRSLQVIGVTGTKGKTTTCYLLAHLLKGLGKKTGLMTTVETVIGEHRFPSTLTTHGVLHNQRSLAEMRQEGLEAAVLEVSSHGLDQGRVDGIDFSVGVFTNLTPDHLDYHGSVEEYAAAKKKLFAKSRLAVLNGDSHWSQEMASGKEALFYGFQEGNDVRIASLEQRGKKMSCLVAARGETASFSPPWVGRFNLYNALAALSVGLSLGFSLKEMAPILEKGALAPGRLEKVPNSKGFKVFVDYAHTGASLREALSTLKEERPKRLFVVFGCGGNRDPGRRAAMGSAAESLADCIFLTNDNPRTEDPEEIVRQILEGIHDKGKVSVEFDRKKAIEQAVSQMTSDDLLLIAGKGHEKCQIFAHYTQPFDDVAIAKEAIRCCAG